MLTEIRVRPMVLSGVALLSLALAALGASDAPAPPDPSDTKADLRWLRSEMEFLKQRQDFQLDALKTALDKGFYLLVVIGGIGSLVTFLQYKRDDRMVKSLEQQVTEGKDLARSYKANIDSTNALINSVRSAVEWYGQVQQKLADVAKLEADQKSRTLWWEDEMRELNQRAVDLSRSCKRNAHNVPSVQRDVRDFYERLQIVQRSTTTAEKLNANGHFIVAFYYRIQNRYQEAIEAFNTAISAAESLIPAGQPASLKLPAGANYSEWLRKLQNVCCFHSGILVYNLGEYLEAIKWFEKAITLDSYDFQSMIYIPESLFLGVLEPLDSVVLKFETLASKLKSLTEEQSLKFALPQKRLLALVYMKLGNCFMSRAETRSKDGAAAQTLDKAEHYMEEAVKADGDFVLAQFSLAQVLHQRKKDRIRYLGYFAETYKRVREEAGKVSEAKILMMNNYILAICCALGELAGELPTAYTMRIYELAPQLPNQDRLRLFSPLTKADLLIPQFLSEVRAFESSLLGRSAAASAKSGRV